MAQTYTWPEWMPKPQQSGYDVQVSDRRTKTDMEMGGIIRAEFDVDEAVCQCKLILSPEEAAWFEAFERHLLKQGATWFRMPLWVSGQLSLHTVRFRERPKISRLVGLYTEYSFALDISVRNTLPKDYIEILLEYGPDALRAFSTRLHEILHVEAPGVTIIPNPL